MRENQDSLFSANGGGYGEVAFGGKEELYGFTYYGEGGHLVFWIKVDHPEYEYLETIVKKDEAFELLKFMAGAVSHM